MTSPDLPSSPPTSPQLESSCLDARVLLSAPTSLPPRPSPSLPSADRHRPCHGPLPPPLHLAYYTPLARYLYLLFAAPDALPIDMRALVLTTEAHLLPAAPLRAAAGGLGAAGADDEGSTEAEPVYAPWWS